MIVALQESVDWFVEHYENGARIGKDKINGA